MTFEFHVSREARERYGVDEALFTLTGNVVLPNLAASRRLAARMNQRLDAARHPNRVVHGGQLNAMGLIDEILHRVVELYRHDVNPGAMRDALAAVADRVGAERLEETLGMFVKRFPTAQAYRDGTSPSAYLGGQTDGVPNREIAVQELLLLWLANANPAFAPFEELFDDEALRDTPYSDVVAGLIAFFATQPAFGPESQTLIEMLRSPAIAVPDSLAGQLRFVRERWTSLLGEFLDRLIVNLDVVAQEELDNWRRFHPTGGGGGGAEDAARRSGRAWLAESGWYGRGEGESEEERFSTDRDWMPRLVLLAKSTYVWLDQLSRQYGREIARLDQIPDEELDRLARWGFTGLWLIGLWQRSHASQRIKVLRGNPEAVASAYSLDDYRIADDLGGEEAFERLKSRAWARGVRIASDMVPNHMGIDSRWVMEHPDWFISVPAPPYPAYSFSGPDLSNDQRVEIYLEDHYFDNTDAAVVFKRVDHWTGDERYVYHGNDGTSMPWNDTAQLNYLREDVREAVIQTILGVARRSPVIRFDAAMTLAKRHIERLWFPEPGHGGGIPSRAEHAMPKDDFERLMPVEFWREVVDRVASEVPDTLLLAEAFWLMEGYFVRTLGMHRVYNSAFMNMLRDEQNANYRSVIKNTIEFDPEVLKRYVNFMNNPDERTAVDQFGKGDKYFGVATLMATLPGLPMVGHGQIEGYTERYGMEYRRAYFDERPDPSLVERHEREIVPLLHRRALFADVDDFLLFDVVRDDGTVNEDVFAYSNRGGGERTLVVYHNRYGSTSGRIWESVPYASQTDAGGRALTRRTIGMGLGLHDEDGWYLALRDVRSGLESLRSSRDVHAHGLRLDLDAYACRVYLGIRELQDTAGRPWGRLEAELRDRGVPSLDEAMRAMLLRPVQEPFIRLLESGRLRRLREATSHQPATSHDVTARIQSNEDVAAILRDLDDLAAAIRAQIVAMEPDTSARAATRERLLAELGRLLALSGRAAVAIPVGPSASPAATDSDGHDHPDVAAWDPGATVRADAGTWTAEVGRVILGGLDDLVGGPAGGGASMAGAGPPPAGARAREWLDQFGLAPVLAEGFRAAGEAEADSWRCVEGVRVLVGARRWPLDHALSERTQAILRSWLADDAAGRFLQVNVHRDVRWFNREAFHRLVNWAAIAELVRTSNAGETRATEPDADDVGATVRTATGDGLPETIRATRERLLDAADRSGYRVDALLAAVDAEPAGATTE